MIGTLEQAQALLAAAGFSILDHPLQVAGVPFEFAAAMSSGSTLDLVVLIDTFQGGSQESARRDVTELARALDIAESRRPLTVVLVGKRWSELTERAMSRVARVLRCDFYGGDETARDASIRDALAVLLPLQLPPSPDRPEESWASFRSELLRESSEPDLHKVVEAASSGPETVKRTLVEFLSRPLGAPKDD